MRKIKFRVYCKGLDEGMYYPKTFLLSNQGNYVVKVGGDDFKMKDDTNEIVLMQYTGLKDNSGKEIYEGDILELEYNNPNVNPKPRLKVWFAHGCFRAGEIFRLSECVDIAEVVGNIYENPNLLERVND